MKASLGTLYDMNKEKMKTETPINKFQFRQKLEEIKGYFKKNGKYYMLLCHELRNYTLFNLGCSPLKDSAQEACEALKDCINNRGRIISIDYVESENAYEIWILMNGNDPCAYYLFPYSEGVIEC